MKTVLQGGDVDRIPFVTYEGIAGPHDEVWNALGRENVGLLRWCGACRMESPDCHFETEDVLIAATPVGLLKQLEELPMAK